MADCYKQWDAQKFISEASSTRAAVGRASPSQRALF